jgi:hypothetical protein
MNGRAAGQELTARARVDSTRFLVGDWITVQVDVAHPPGTTLEAAIPDSLGRYIVVERGTPESRGAGATRMRVVVSAYDSGRFALPPLEFLARVPGDTTARRIGTDSLPLTIATVVVDTAEGIRDIAPPMSIPIGMAEVLLFLGILALIAVAVFLVRRFRRRTPAPAPAAPPPPAVPAHVLALQELGALKERRLWQQGLVKPYYSELTEIVRRYFENRYAVQALEQTTDEIMAALERHPSSSVVRAEIEDLLRRADLVKFAKLEPGIAEHEAGMKTAYDIVERTRAAERALQERAGTHVGA